MQATKTRNWNGVIREFQEFLPKVKDDSVVTLREGNTPLIEVLTMGELFERGLKIFLKYEGLNPTGSFKDRGMTMAVSKAKEEGSHAVICASTGNTSAAAAAYAARGGLRAYVLIPEGKIALGKLSQAMMHGAKVVQIQGNFDEALIIVKEVSMMYPVTLVNSINPYRLEGQKTAAFEVCNHLGFAPTYHFLPVGNAGNITAYWRGYKEFKERGVTDSLPKMMGFEAEGSAPIVRGHPIKNPETIASAIRIGNPSSWENAVKAKDESGGIIDMVSDDEIIYAYKLLAREGVFCEPASAASLAGVIKMHKKGIFKNGDTIVCTLTGHGLKDPDTAIKSSDKPITAEPELGKVVELLGF
ncbi:MAG: threonine synthase [Deltaproteobacteria bacterium]|nr:threonine synthase [Deltaproteobacteria bacterium]